MRNAVTTDKAPKPMGPYSQAIVDGDLVYLAGMGPVSPETGKPELGDIRAQTTLTFRNVKAVLEAAGSSLDRVIRCTVYLQDIADFAAMNEVYARRFQEAFPARSTIQVAGLPKGARIEVEVHAVKHPRPAAAPRKVKAKARPDAKAGRAKPASAGRKPARKKGRR
jgi:2-iminobutanoate/2-iminopropanoate deaminase